MRIQIGTAKGQGASKESAFDSALAKIGINNYNLVEYSSVIPADAVIDEVDTIEVDAPYGTPIGCVTAKGFGEPRNPAHLRTVAHLVWDRSDSGHGWFLEGNDRTINEKEVIDMANNRPEYNFDTSDYSDAFEVNEVGAPELDSNQWLCCTCVAVYGPIETMY